MNSASLAQNQNLLVSMIFAALLGFRSFVTGMAVFVGGGIGVLSSSRSRLTEFFSCKVSGFAFTPSQFSSTAEAESSLAQTARILAKLTKTGSSALTAIFGALRDAATKTSATINPEFESSSAHALAHVHGSRKTTGIVIQHKTTATTPAVITEITHSLESSTEEVFSITGVFRGSVSHIAGVMGQNRNNGQITNPLQRY